MDELDALLAAKASQGSGDSLDALLGARAANKAPAAPTVAQGPSAPTRPMEPPSFIEKQLAKLPNFPGWIGDRGGAVGRVAMGVADPLVGTYQLAANAMGQGDTTNFPGQKTGVNQRIHDVEQQYEASRAANGSSGFDPLRMGGNVATSLVAPATRVAATGGLLAKMLRGGAVGAGFNAAQPVTDAQPAKLSDLVTGQEPKDYWTEKRNQTLIGGGMGVAGVPISASLASIVRPSTSDAARKLMDAGVNLTPGQILGGGFHRAEDAATSIPVLGDFVRDAKNRTLADFQRATYARALEPIGVDASKLPAGPAGVAAVKSALGDAYDALLPKLSFDVKTVAPELANLRQMAKALPAQEAKEFNAILDKNLGQLSGGKADGETFKLIVESLGKESKTFSGATDGYQRKLGAALAEAQGVFRQGLAKSNPDYAAQLAKIDEGYANYARIRGAAASAGDKSHGYTPAQLAAAIRNQDATAGKGATATGTALMQDLSDAARTVLPSQVGDSGTPLRHAIQAGIGGLVGHSVLPESMSALMVPAAGAVGGLALPYTTMGQKLAQKVLAERPEYAASLAAALRRIGPVAGAAAAPALTNGLGGVN